MRVESFFGKMIRFTHQAGVARWMYINSDQKDKGKEWVFIEPKKTYPWAYESAFSYENRDKKWTTPITIERHDRQCIINKNVFEWESDGTGLVTGWITRMIGESVPGYRSSSGGYYGDYDDYQQGYFVEHERVKLLVVKTQPYGLGYILVPPDKVEVIDGLA